jgi:excisionase family DNA binding protein
LNGNDTGTIFQAAGICHRGAEGIIELKRLLGWRCGRRREAIDLPGITARAWYNKISHPVQKERAMSLIKTWYTVDEAAAKFGVPTKQLLAWVENGVLRSEGDKGKAVLLNGDDIERELNLSPSV